jgi:hypothetical protein
MGPARTTSRVTPETLSTMYARPRGEVPPSSDGRCHERTCRSGGAVARRAEIAEWGTVPPQAQLEQQAQLDHRLASSGPQNAGVDSDVVVTRLGQARCRHCPGLMTSAPEHGGNGGIDILVEHKPHAESRCLTASISASERSGYAARIRSSLSPRSRYASTVSTGIRVPANSHALPDCPAWCTTDHERRSESPCTGPRPRRSRRSATS